MAESNSKSNLTVATSMLTYIAQVIKVNDLSSGIEKMVKVNIALFVALFVNLIANVILASRPDTHQTLYLTWSLDQLLI
jgi:SNF family Na+-dependent transporter